MRSTTQSTQPFVLSSVEVVRYVRLTYGRSNSRVFWKSHSSACENLSQSFPDSQRLQVVKKMSNLQVGTLVSRARRP